MEGRKGACLRAVVLLLGDGIVGVVDGGGGNNNNSNNSERTFEAESAPLLFSFFFSLGKRMHLAGRKDGITWIE